MQIIGSAVVAVLNFWFLSTRNQLNSYIWSLSWLWKDSKYTFYSLKNDSMSTFLKRRSKQKYFEMIERYIGVNRLFKRNSFSFISWIILSIKHWLSARFEEYNGTSRYHKKELVVTFLLLKNMLWIVTVTWHQFSSNDSRSANSNFVKMV